MYCVWMRSNCSSGPCRNVRVLCKCFWFRVLRGELGGLGGLGGENET